MKYFLCVLAVLLALAIQATAYWRFVDGVSGNVLAACIIFGVVLMIDGLYGSGSHKQSIIVLISGGVLVVSVIASWGIGSSVYPSRCTLDESSDVCSTRLTLAAADADVRAKAGRFLTHRDRDVVVIPEGTIQASDRLRIATGTEQQTGQAVQFYVPTECDAEFAKPQVTVRLKALDKNIAENGERGTYELNVLLCN